MAQNFKLRHSRNGTKFPFCHEIIYIPHHIYPASAFFPFSSCAICGMARNFKLRHSRNGTKLIRGINSRNAQKNRGPQIKKSDFLVNSFRVSDGRKSDFSRLGPQFSISDGLLPWTSESAKIFADSEVHGSRTAHKSLRD